MFFKACIFANKIIAVCGLTTPATQNIRDML